MKIAIVGTAPQWREAPLQDPEWQLWGVPGCYPERMDRVYEIHAADVLAADAEQRPGFIEYARALGPGFVIREPNPKYPAATIYDFQKYIRKHGPYFSSSISWMIAEAIEVLASANGVKALGLWGVNMASDSEYGHQKPSATYLLGWARALGIEVVIPETSELLWTPWQYGLEDKPHALSVLAEKIENIKAKLAVHEQGMAKEKEMVDQYKGALHFAEYMQKNFYRGK